jgi:hypothetical protein
VDARATCSQPASRGPDRYRANCGPPHGRIPTSRGVPPSCWTFERSWWVIVFARRKLSTSKPSLSACAVHRGGLQMGRKDRTPLAPRRESTWLSVAVWQPATAMFGAGGSQVGYGPSAPFAGAARVRRVGQVPHPSGASKSGPCGCRLRPELSCARSSSARSVLPCAAQPFGVRHMRHVGGEPGPTRTSSVTSKPWRSYNARLRGEVASR